MEAILDQQAELLRVGEELIRESSRKLRDAAGPDALRQAYELYRGFYEAVDWTEPWLVAVLSLHAMLLLVAVATRKSQASAQPMPAPAQPPSIAAIVTCGMVWSRVEAW